MLSVLPRQPSTITADAAAALGLPDCVVGVVYNFEAVPTDVDLAATAGTSSACCPAVRRTRASARAAAWSRSTRANGNATRLATGLLGATSVALGPDGKIFVSELFGGKISLIDRARSRTYVELDCRSA